MMSFTQEEKGYSNMEEDQDDDEVLGDHSTSDLNFPFSSSSSSADPDLYPHHHHQNLWLLGSIDNSQEEYRPIHQESCNLDQNPELMELSLGSNEESNTSGGAAAAVEKEHMFDKVVTPSDVGKLNRLVIPKQHAERYFPIDSSSNEKGLILNFEDRNGKSWRFRYSYWNSSQSYVMTKGWSRFVKDKQLDAGDVVSFHRGVGENEKGKLYIDWRRRPESVDTSTLAQIQYQNHVRWGSRLYLPPQSIPPPPLHRLNYGYYPYNQPQHHHPQPPGYYFRSSGSSSYHPNQIGSVPNFARRLPVIIDSVPVVEGKTAGKRLRLFGVNMDCPVQDDGKGIATPFPPLQPRLPQMQQQQQQSEYSKKGKSSLSIDLDQ